MTRFYLQTHAKGNAMIGLCRKFVAFLTKNSPERLFLHVNIIEMDQQTSETTHKFAKVCRHANTCSHALQGANSGALTAIISKARTR